MPLDGTPTSALPLPEGWTLSERVDDVVEADGLAIRRVGLCASKEERQVVGSAASVDADQDPSQRARFELLERIAIDEAMREPSKFFTVRSASGEDLDVIRASDLFPVSDAPERWAFARSNGVSLHRDWAAACTGAAAELVERDRVLRAWLGETLALRIDAVGLPMLKAGPSYEWRTYVFPPADAVAFGRELEVVGVFGFPTTPSAPLVFGYGARPSRDQAVQAALREATQLLSFLWGEPIPDAPPKPLPAPMTHLETYQVRDRHPVLRRWLEVGHAKHARPHDAEASTTIRYADITPSWLQGGFRVARAICPAAIPLAFGLSPLLAHLPPELRIHPIP